MDALGETAHFREGAGRLCLDFIRTVRQRGSAEAAEELADPTALAAWVQQCGPRFDARRSLPGTADVVAARELREAIYELVMAARDPADPGSGTGNARRRVNQVAARPVPAPSLDADGQVHWYADDPVAATLALVARDAIELATSTAITRVRQCAGADCAALFLDSSRPGTRRWCSMNTCGNRAKKDNLRRHDG